MVPRVEAENTEGEPLEVGKAVSENTEGELVLVNSGVVEANVAVAVKDCAGVGVNCERVDSGVEEEHGVA